MKNLGAIVKKLRQSNNYSQEELAKLCNCNRKTIYRIEKEEVGISDFMIDKLNSIFNISLNEYLSIIQNYNCYETYLKYNLLRTAINNMDYYLIEKYYEEFKKLEGFKNGEPYYMIHFAKFIILSNNNEQINEITNSSFEILNINSIDELVLIIKKEILLPSQYAIINLLAMNFRNTGDITSSYKVSKTLYNTFNNKMFAIKLSFKKYDISFINKYIAYINNLADCCFTLKYYDNTLTLIDEAISLSKKYNSLYYIEVLLSLKVEVEYMLNNISDSEKYYKQFVSFCIFKDNEKLLVAKEICYKENLPLLFL